MCSLQATSVNLVAELLHQQKLLDSFPGQFQVNHITIVQLGSDQGMNDWLDLPLATSVYNSTPTQLKSYLVS